MFIILFVFQFKIACINFVADCNLSFNVIQSVGFRDLVAILKNEQCEIPSTNAIMDTLDSQFHILRLKLKGLINEQPYICTTADIWTSKSQSYFGMTVHWINSNYERESYILAFRRMKQRHTNEEITKIMRQIFRDFSIDMNAITNIVTDGGSAFCKAFKRFGKSVDTLIDPIMENAHRDTENCDSNNDNISSNMPFMQLDDGEEFYSNIIDFDSDSASTERQQQDSYPERDFESENETELQNNSNEALQTEADLNEFDWIADENPRSDVLFDEYEMNKLPAQKRCLTHVLNLVGSDFTKSLGSAAKKQWTSTLSKLQSIWVFPRRSSLAKEYSKQILGCILIIPVETRWNSEYDSVDKVKQLGMDKINAFVDKLNSEIKCASHINKLSKEDFIMINIYLKVMKPVAISLDKLQGENEGHQGFILPTLFSMKHHLKSIEGGTVLKHCRDVMLNVIDKRLHLFYCISESNRNLLLATASLPKFKLNFIENEIEFIMVKQMLVSEILNSNSNTNQCDTDVQSSADTPDEFFVSFASKRNLRRTSADIFIEDEVTRYLDDERTNFSMLNNYSKIRKIFFRYNTTLSSSASVERAFSQAKFIFTPHRSRILDDNFEKTVFLKINTIKLAQK